jgi:diaminopimelate decarboxylase
VINVDSWELAKRWTKGIPFRTIRAGGGCGVEYRSIGDLYGTDYLGY